LTLKATAASANTDANLDDNIEEAALRVTGGSTPTTPSTPSTPPAATPPTTTGGSVPKKPAPVPTSQPTLAAVPAQAAARGSALVQLPLKAKLNATGLPSGARVRYQWQVQLGNAWIPIVGATGATYTPDPSYAGSRLRVVAKSSGKTMSSAPTPPLKAALQVGGGQVTRVGSALQAKLAPGALAQGAKVRYQWQVLDRGHWLPVVGATRKSFTPDRGAAGMNVRVVASAAGRTVASKPTSPVKRAPKRAPKHS
jgi:hypothetical protein